MECAAVVVLEYHAQHHSAVLMENVKMINASRIHVMFPVILVYVEFVNVVKAMLVPEIRLLVTMVIAFRMLSSTPIRVRR